MNRILLFVCVLLSISLSRASQDTIKIDSTVSVNSVENFCTKKNIVGLGEYIGLKVNNLNKLFSSEKNQNNSLVLYINNVPMHGIQPIFIDTNQNIVVFQLSRNDSTKKVWDLFYNSKSRMNFVKPVLINIGLNDKGAIKGQPGNIVLKLFNNAWRWSMLIIYVAILIVLGFLAKKSNLLRDGKLSEIDPKTNKPKLATYSLAKSQLAIWTLVIVGSIGYIFSTTGELPVISGSTWILLAISIGTTTGASIIGFAPQNVAQLNESKNWLTDILSDNNGMSIHRFQMLVWTVFLVVYFICRVYMNLDLPQLGNELLALMGISNGTYLGLKISEDKKTV